MNEAFRMYMGVNIQKDLAAAAKSYSMKDFALETTKANPYGLAKYKEELKRSTDRMNADYENMLVLQRNN